MPVRLTRLAPQDLLDTLARIDRAAESGEPPTDDDLRAAVKHFLAVLVQRAPGRSVEVRIPPYAAVQCVEGARHTRGTPPAVVETRPLTWIALARGNLDFGAAVRDGVVSASGERSDLSALLPLT